MAVPRWALHLMVKHNTGGHRVTCEANLRALHRALDEIYKALARNEE